MAIFIKFFIFLISFLFLAFPANSQEVRSEYGWHLAPYDTLKILMVFTEVANDNASAEKDVDAWRPGKLPDYANEIFDPEPYSEPVAIMSRYYKEISFGNLVVVADFIDHVITIPEKEAGKSASAFIQAVNNRISEEGILRTYHGSLLEDFDNWEKSPGGGKKKERGKDGLPDHIMYFTRNFAHLGSEGLTSVGNPGKILGSSSNTYSIFMAKGSIPFRILRHELNHLYIGGNNFHAGGGNRSEFNSYFIPTQGGWGMMGGSGSSFLTCNGWDRLWLGWKPKENQHQISARNPQTLEEVNGDIDAGNPAQAGRYLLRDFVTTGDALRIKVPLNDTSQFPQFIWIENHIGPETGSYFDVFQYQDIDCIPNMESGLYLYMQVDKDIREGNGIHSRNYADYIRPLPANGMYDLVFDFDAPEIKTCINGLNYTLYSMLPEWENPLTGNSNMEKGVVDVTGEKGKLDARDEIDLYRKNTEDEFFQYLQLGDPHAGFRLSGNKKIGMGTNPSTVNMKTLVNGRSLVKNANNNTTILLNGISVEIVEESDTARIVEVKFNDTGITRNVRWCADSLILPAISGAEFSLDLLPGNTIILDQGKTPTRLSDPVELNGEMVFTSPTYMSVEKGASVRIGEKAKIHLKNNSTLHLTEGSAVNLEKKGEIIVEKGAMLRIDQEVDVLGKRRNQIKIKKGGTVKVSNRNQAKKLKKIIKGRIVVHQ